MGESSSDLSTTGTCCHGQVVDEACPCGCLASKEVWASIPQSTWKGKGLSRSSKDKSTNCPQQGLLKPLQQWPHPHSLTCQEVVERPEFSSQSGVYGNRLSTPATLLWPGVIPVLYRAEQWQSHQDRERQEENSSFIPLVMPWSSVVTLVWVQKYRHCERS